VGVMCNIFNIYFDVKETKRNLFLIAH